MQVPSGADQIEGKEIAHALLITLLQEHHDGTAELTLSRMQAAMGDADGRVYAFVIEPSDSHDRVRISVVPVSRDADGTVR
jgi:hypothetical protein